MDQLGGFTSYEPYEPKRDMCALLCHEAKHREAPHN
jgi:hypothetical protein